MSSTSNNKVGPIGIFIAIVFAWVLFYPQCSDGPKYRVTEQPAGEEKEPPRRPDGFDASPAMQSQRKRALDDLVDAGLFQSTSAGYRSATLWVTESFFLRTAEKEKNQLLEVVYAYLMGEYEEFGGPLYGWDLLKVKIDNGTVIGRTVGYYEPIAGLRE